MGSAQSARGIQLGEQGTAARCGGIPSRDPSPGAAGPRRAHFLRGGAPRPALGRLGKARGEGGTPLRPRALQRPPPGPRRFPGPWNECSLRPLGPTPRPSRGPGGGRGRGPLLPARLSTGADCPQCAPTASRRQGGDRPTYKGARGLRRCRQPIRPVLKHGPRSLTRARVRGCDKPRGAMKVRAGARRLRWDPGPPGLRAHHRPVSPALSGRWSMSARDRTRKMVNYAWAGRSQRKLWWRPAAVLTCKSVVRPGYRGERLIEPSSSWFLPKSPSGPLALEVSQFYLVKRMIRGLGAETISTYSQTLNG